MKVRGTHSRLMRREEKQSLRKAVIFFLLTILILAGTIFLGIPALVKVAVFLAELKGSSLPVEQTDLIPPAPPRLDPIPEAVKTNLIGLSGSAEAGANVEIYLNDGLVLTIISDNDSHFITEKIRLEQGKNSVYITAIDKAGNKSSPSEKAFIWFDDQPPDLTIEQPADNSRFSGQKERTIIIQGKTEADINLSINDRFIIVGNEGNYSTSYSLNEGENKLTLIARDKAENETKKELTVFYFP